MLVDIQTRQVQFTCQVGVPFENRQGGEVLAHCLPLVTHAVQPGSVSCYHWYFNKQPGVKTSEWSRELLDNLINRVQEFRNERHVAFLLLQHPVSGPEFSWVDSKLLSLFKHHVKLALLLFAKTQEGLVSAKLESDLLNRLNFGLAVADSKGRIIRYNDAAWRCLNDWDGLYLSEGAITTDPGIESPFWQDIQQALEKDQAGIKIVTRPSGKQPYQICYLPVTDSIKSVAGKPFAVLFLFDASHGSAGLSGFIELAYNMSKVESRLACAISRGMSPEDYATTYDLGISTVRTHLKSIFRKTSTKGQAHLTKLLSGIEMVEVAADCKIKPRVKPKRRRNRSAVDISGVIDSLEAATAEHAGTEEQATTQE